ncbi:hypothetical protein L5515_014133 [Caenorhabditis briggsae]|uniref:Uncharacterized protein n=1 Tax=Caenorhabditis briggsae TaxID=6238 RepID=A0AAE9ECI2_CAEBR|nr:hypothetical protein L5515_014133 [Caenorhabditis briggsae]
MSSISNSSIDSCKFHYVPRHGRLTPEEKSSLDRHARSMAELMMQKQDSYRYYERMKKFDSDDNSSGLGSCSNDGSYNLRELRPNPPENSTKLQNVMNWLATSSDIPVTQSSGAYHSPSSAQLVPNPLYDPNYAKKVANPHQNQGSSCYQSVSKTPSTPQTGLIPNPFYDPAYTQKASNSQLRQVRYAPNSSYNPSVAPKSSAPPVGLIPNPFYDPTYVKKSTIPN